MCEIFALESAHAVRMALKPAKMTAVLPGCGDKIGEAASRLFGGENNG